MPKTATVDQIVESLGKMDPEKTDPRMCALAISNAWTNVEMLSNGDVELLAAKSHILKTAAACYESYKLRLDDDANAFLERAEELHPGMGNSIYVALKTDGIFLV